MPDDKESVITARSDDGQMPDNAPRERDRAVKSGDRSLEQVMEENKRKAAEIAELRERVQELGIAQDRLNELHSKNTLTESEEDEEVELREQIEAIRRDKRSRAWRELLREESGADAESRIIAREKIRAERSIKKFAQTEGMEYDKFEREIVGWMRKVDPGADLPVDIRAEDAYEAFKADKNLHAREEALKKKEQSFKESEGRPAEAPKSKAEMFDRAKKDPNEMARLLAGIAIGQEARSR